uniref:Uncharacterized protein n=1 Tax=Caldiarchaeum subterraneum TaxID=311458 RepID=A0A7J3VTZ8_CALS0
MKRTRAALVLAALLLIPSTVGADGYSSIVDNGRIKISLSYPAEVKIGSCFPLVLQTTFLGSVSVQRLRLTVVYVSEAGSTTLLNDVIISSLTSFSPGNVVSKTYSVCVPSAVRRDPLVSAVVFVNYSRGMVFEPLTHEWMLAVVRDRTYPELLNELANAERSLSSLRRAVEELQSQVSSLRSRLEDLLRENVRLSTSLEEARREYGRLEDRYEALSIDYKALNERYVNVLGDLRALQTLYESLLKENTGLNENYRSLLSDYRNLTREFTALQASFTQLQVLYNSLSDRHDGARQQIGYLQSELEAARASLRDIQLQYAVLTGENSLHRNLAYAQAFVLVVVATGMASVFVSRRIRKNRPHFQALPPPPPPPPEKTP